jgi:hypothetical protein
MKEWTEGRLGKNKFSKTFAADFTKFMLMC